MKANRKSAIHKTTLCIIIFSIERHQGPFMLTHKTTPFLFCFLLCFSNNIRLSVSNEPAVFSEWCLWQPHYTNRSQELNPNWDWSVSEHIQRVNEPQKARLSVRPGAWFVCTVITPFEAVPRYTKNTHRGFTMGKKDAHLCPTMDFNPSSSIVLFVMMNWTRETSHTWSQQAHS